MKREIAADRWWNLLTTYRGGKLMFPGIVKGHWVADLAWRHPGERVKVVKTITPPRSPSWQDRYIQGVIEGITMESPLLYALKRSHGYPKKTT